MKSFFGLLLIILLLFGFLLAVSAFLGRDLLLNLKQAFDSQKSSSVSNHQKVISRFAIISDTHADDIETQKAIDQIKGLKVDYLIHTGDWTKVGTVAEFESQKKIVESADLPYWGIMGDHDRWQSGAANFEAVFGKIYESFDRSGLHHILLDASDITNGFGKEQLDWLEKDLAKNQAKPILIFMHLPIYHPTSDRTIGSKGGQSDERSSETDRFLNLIKGKKILGMFSGDHHLSSSYTEPKTSVRIFISGAVTRERNLQNPRFTLVEVFADFSLSVTDQEIN